MNEIDLLRAQMSAVEQLVEVLEQVVAHQSRQLDDALEFIAIASHELKNPLNVLSGELHILLNQARRGGAQGEQLVAGIDVAIRQTERLTHLLEQLLDVERITAGHLKLQLELVELSRLIPDVVERLRDTIEGGGCRVALHVQTGVAGRWDRLRLEQALVNLLTNAVKYGGRGLIEVSLETDTGQVTIVVRDHGSGIPPGQQSRIFERFVRAAPHGVGGVGLGLYITRQIVEQHGGRIRVESQPGAGAAFYVSLPLLGSETEAAMKETGP